MQAVCEVGRAQAVYIQRQLQRLLRPDVQMHMLLSVSRAQ